MLQRKIHDFILSVKKTLPYIFRPHHIAFLFGSPFHSNMGDQAQTMCIEDWIHINYPNYKVWIYTRPQCTDHIFKLIRFFIRKDDLLFCHSGYHMTDLYPLEKLPYLEAAKRFKDFPIVIFPQTVNYIDWNLIKESVNVFNSHGNITLMCRDEVSYEVAKRYFTNCKLLLMPDIVTNLIGTKSYSSNRNGVLVCVRHDKEARYSEEDIEVLKSQINANVDVTDTTIQIDPKVIISNRRNMLEGLFEQYSKYKVIVTDRYHGTIFSLIAETPVIVVGTTDHKLESGVKWFPSEYKDYVHFVPDLNSSIELVNEYLQRNDLSYTLSPYFYEHYYKDLKTRLQNGK